jgi:DNA-binding helix-hairpin-helix protein with protein kinase domain
MADNVLQALGLTRYEIPIEGHVPLWFLYNPKMRLQHFPGRDWRFLFAVAANVARAFDAMHQAGVVIGDVNHSNLLAASSALTSRPPV